MIKYYKNIDKIGYVPIEDVKMKFIVSGCFDLPLTSKNLCESGQIAMAYYIVNAFGRYFEGNGNIKRATNAEAISYLLVHEWYQQEESEKETNTIEERHENGRFKEGNCFNYIQEISCELVTALHFLALGSRRSPICLEYREVQYTIDYTYMKKTENAGKDFQYKRVYRHQNMYDQQRE